MADQSAPAAVLTKEWLDTVLDRSKAPFYSRYTHREREFYRSGWEDAMEAIRVELRELCAPALPPASPAVSPRTCTYPACECPFDAPADPNWCARGLPKKQKVNAS